MGARSAPTGMGTRRPVMSMSRTFSPFVIAANRASFGVAESNLGAGTRARYSHAAAVSRASEMRAWLAFV